MAEQKKGWFDVVKSSYVWKSMFRHEYQDTYRNRVLQVSSNVFLHLHPTKIRRHALRLRFTWCMGGITFLLFLIEVVTGIILMFYYRPTEYAPLSTSEKWIKALRLWVIRYDDRFITVSAICTHLGCTPRYLATEDKYKCPCHGSGYRGFASGWKVNATNFEGPAPRPMERVKLALADDGQIIVDKSITFRIEKGDFDKPGAYLPYS